MVNDKAPETAFTTLCVVGGERAVVAEWIISLARSGVIDAKVLSNRVVAVAKAMRSL